MTIETILKSELATQLNSKYYNYGDKFCTVYFILKVHHVLLLNLRSFGPFYHVDLSLFPEPLSKLKITLKTDEVTK